MISIASACVPWCDRWRCEHRRRIADAGGNHASHLRIRSCMPQKQPPASTARSVFSVICESPCSLDRLNLGSMAAGFNRDRADRSGFFSVSCLRKSAAVLPRSARFL